MIYKLYFKNYSFFYSSFEFTRATKKTYGYTSFVSSWLCCHEYELLKRALKLNTHKYWNVRFQVLTSASMKTIGFRDIAPCSLHDIHQPDDRDSTNFWNICLLPNYTALYPTRLSFSYIGISPGIDNYFFLVKVGNACCEREIEFKDNSWKNCQGWHLNERNYIF
jgi:hypothetical protein